MDTDINVQIEEYDVIVIGTGLVESIASGALARHLKVLHLDTADRYGLEYGNIDCKTVLELGTAKTYHAKSAESRSEQEAEQVQETSAQFIESITSQSRRYNLEQTPKMLLSRGDIVELIISSGTGSYLEFRLVEKLYFWFQNTLNLVPGSKEDVFINKEMTLIQKRRLMKFLTFAMDFEASPEVYEGFMD
jgi:Rab proteins geranylgeranyltransferase component A